MNTRATACDLVTLARRYADLGGSSGLTFTNPAPDVAAVAELIVAAHTAAWIPPHGNVPGTITMNVNGISIDVWGVVRPAGFDVATTISQRFDAERESGKALLVMSRAAVKRVRKAAA